jgi:DNA-binding NtrC family response regulator
MHLFEKLKGLKTLLVDDDEFVRGSLQIAFRTRGCFLQTAETAEEGLRAMEENQFDIIISDLRLPGVDGLAFLESAGRCQPEAMCVLITAYRDALTTADTLAAGIHDLIEKPFSVGVLVESLVSRITARKKTGEPQGRIN